MSDLDDDVDLARRRLLRMLVYTPPVVLGVVVVKKAHAQPTSCGPASCNPSGGPCGPNGCLPRGGDCGPTACMPRA